MRGGISGAEVKPTKGASMFSMDLCNLCKAAYTRF